MTKKTRKKAPRKKATTKRKATRNATRNARKASKPAAKRPRGRPTRYTPEIAEEILRRIPTESVRRICEDEHLPPATTVHTWVIEDREGFAEQYARAIQLRAMNWAEELIEVARNPQVGEIVTEESKVIVKDGEDGEQTEMPVLERKVVKQDMVAHRRLHVDTLKWALCKMLPKTFGDKLAIGGDPDAPAIKMTDVERGAQIQALLQVAAQRKAEAEGEGDGD